MEAITKKPDGTFEYGTLQEAERRLAEKQQKRRRTLCPLMSATCSADCVCYDKPGVVNIETEEKPFWNCKGGCCTCYMLMGPV